MNWMRVIIPKNEQERARALPEAFDKLWQASGRPSDAALFVGRRHGSDDFSHYFTPAGAQIAGPLIRLCAGEPCDPPDPAGVSAVVGNEDAVERLLGR